MLFLGPPRRPTSIYKSDNAPPSGESTSSQEITPTSPDSKRTKTSPTEKTPPEEPVVRRKLSFRRKSSKKDSKR